MSLLTVKDLGRMLNIHHKTIYRWTNEGRIPHVRIKGLIRFDMKEIKNWKEKNGKKNTKFYEFLPKFDLSIGNYDKMLLKGRSALSKKSGRWNYGIGTIYIRKMKGGKERWYVDYRDENGNRVRKVARHSQSRGEALLELQSEIMKMFDKAHRLNREKQKMKLRDLARQYLENYAKVNNIAWKRVETCLNNLCGFMGGCRLQNVSPLLIEKYKSKRLKEGIMQSTVNRELSVLKRAFNLAIDWKMAVDNPVRKVRFLRQPE
ncbi:MAG: helix-turn-helix domain-containing protein, partial [Candidatus Aminicenantaceae bacterium]